MFEMAAEKRQDTDCDMSDAENSGRSRRTGTETMAESSLPDFSFKEPDCVDSPLGLIDIFTDSSSQMSDGIPDAHNLIDVVDDDGDEESDAGHDAQADGDDLKPVPNAFLPVTESDAAGDDDGICSSSCSSLTGNRPPDDAIPLFDVVDVSSCEDEESLVLSPVPSDEKWRKNEVICAETAAAGKDDSRASASGRGDRSLGIAANPDTQSTAAAWHRSDGPALSAVSVGVSVHCYIPAVPTVDASDVSHSGRRADVPAPLDTVVPLTAGVALDASVADAFPGFTSDGWRAPRARWLSLLASIVRAEQDEPDTGQSRADSAVLRLQHTALAAAAAGRSHRPSCVCGQRQSVGIAEPAVSTCRCPADTGRMSAYTALLPDREKEKYKDSFLWCLNLVNRSVPIILPKVTRSMRQRLRKRKVRILEEDAEEHAGCIGSSPKKEVKTLGRLMRSVHGGAGMSGASAARARAKTAGVGQLLQRSRPVPAAAEDSSGDEAAPQQRVRRVRRRLLDLCELVEVDGVLELGDTYSGSDQPPPLQAEPPAGGWQQPAGGPPQLRPQRWLRAGSSRCTVCHKFLPRPLMQLHLRVHRTGYRGCDVCGQVFERTAALYRHRLDHEPARHRCSLCGQSFVSEPPRLRHLVSVHRLSFCNVCGVPVSLDQTEHQCEPGPDVQQQQQQQQLNSSAAGQPSGPEPPSHSGRPAEPEPIPSLGPGPGPTDEPTEPASANNTDLAADGSAPLSCNMCNKTFLVRFNHAMHMRVVHNVSVGGGGLDVRRGKSVCTKSPLHPGSSLNCLTDILSPDLFSEIVSVM